MLKLPPELRKAWGISSTAPVVASLQLQTSALGRTIAAIFGKTRIAPNLIWYGDVLPPSISIDGGGGGGKGGIRFLGWRAAVLLGLSEGPISSVMNVWNGKSRSTLAALNLSFFSGSYSQSPASFMTTNHPDEALAYRGIAYLASAVYNLSDNAQLPNHNFEVAGLLPYGSTGQSGKTFTADASTDTLAATAHGYTANTSVRVSSNGTLPGGLASSLPTDFYILNPTANAFQLSLEPGGAVVDITSAGSGTHTVILWIPDAEPTAVIAELVTNANFGLQQSSAILGSFAQAAAGCIANGIFVSPAYIDPEAAGEIITRLAQIANAAPFWSEDVLKLAPYWDASVTGNGVAFTPDLTPIYDLGDDDYLDLDQPVKCERSTPADAYNQRSLRFMSRENQYNEVPSEFKDQADIELNGLKQDSEQMLREIADPQVAQKVIDTIGRAGLYALRNTHTIQVPWRYDLIEPMDLVTLTDSAMGLNLQLVRVLEIEELDDGEGGLQLLVQEVDVGAASPAIYASQAAAGFKTDFNVAPGSVNAPLVFDGPGIQTVSGFEIWVAVSGVSANWGGCNVWLSTDDVEYKQAGTVNGPARHGVLSATFASGADPDTVHPCSVDLTQSRGELAGGTQADADNFSTLSFVDGELLAFETAELTAQYQYDLKDYIRRGVYNTPIGSHSSGAAFARCDSALFRYAYDPAFIGKTIFLKFASFNVYGGGGEDLAAVAAYPYTIAGPIGAPAAVTGYTVSQNGAVAVFQWDLITSQANIKGYEIRYLPKGALASAWESATPLTRVTRGTQITTAKLPPGAWTTMMKAVDNSEKYSLTAVLYDITMQTTFDQIQDRRGDPDWVGLETFCALDESNKGQAARLMTPWVVETAATVLASHWGTVRGTQSLGSGKWYWETKLLSGSQVAVGVVKAGANLEDRAGVDANGWSYRSDGNKFTGNTATGYGATFTAGDTIGVALDVGAGTLEFVKNGASQGVAFTGLSGAFFVAVSVGDLVQGYSVVAFNPGKAPLLFAAPAGFTSGVYVNPATSGLLSRFVKLPSGVLIPDSQTLAGALGLEPFDSLSWNPYPDCYYEGAELDLGIDDTTRIWANIESALAPTSPAGGIADPQLQMDSRTAAGAYAGFTPWTIGSILCRFAKGRLHLDTAHGVPFVNVFDFIADTEERIVTSGTLTVAAGGTTFNFNQPFHVVPTVEFFNDGTVSRIPVVTNVTTASFKAQLFNDAGTDAGGTGHYKATGV